MAPINIIFLFPEQKTKQCLLHMKNLKYQINSTELCEEEIKFHIFMPHSFSIEKLYILTLGLKLPAMLKEQKK